MQMMLDFKADWHAILRRVMEKELEMIVAPDCDAIPILYFNAIQRRVQPRPRALHIADTFMCPDHLREGWRVLMAKIAEGQELMAHLSKLVRDPECTDAMLNDWGVHHFHLGLDLKNGWAQRTSELVFARITPDAFYAIGIYDHRSWADDEIVETVHRNWPESISRWQIKGASATPLTAVQRKALRQKNMNAFFLTRDGTSYGPIGGGMMASGHNFDAVRSMDKYHDFLEQLEERLREISPTIEEMLANAGRADAEQVRAELVLTEGFYSALFARHRLMISFYPRSSGEGGITP